MNIHKTVSLIFTILLIVAFAMIPLFGQDKQSEVSKASMVSPYKLSIDEEEIIKLTATEPRDLLSYEIQLNHNQTISTKIDYYHNGIKKNTVLKTSEPNKKGKFLISFGQHSFYSANRAQHQWFIATQNGFSTTLQDVKSDQSISTFLQIQSSKELEKNKYLTIAFL
jgi:hypothetical protein